MIAKRPPQVSRWRCAMRGAALSAAAGLVFWFAKFGGPLMLRSYDLPFAFRQVKPPSGVTIVYLDEITYQESGEQPRAFDRAHHAELLRYLKKDGAKLVVFDIWFDAAVPERPGSDQSLASALRENGNVVLLGKFIEEDRQFRRLPPWEGFRTNAAGWGVGPTERDLALTVRQFNWRKASDYALPWVAAARIRPGLISAEEHARTEWWLNYYGPPGTIDSVSYRNVTNQVPRYFQDRSVFVGSRTASQYAHEQADQFRTPYTEWVGAYSTGVEIMATAFLNLLHKESLRRLPSWWEGALIVLLGGAAGFGLALGLGRPIVVGMTALLGAGALAVLGIALVQPTHVWFPWLIPVVVQIPSAWAWVSWTGLKRSWVRRPAVEEPAELRETRVSGIESPTPADPSAAPRIPDHVLLRRIGRGAYGEVWLARNAVGIFQAVKVVYQREFNLVEPYEREFRGIEKFMPISRSHPGFVHILHVGRNDAEGLFYCIMELADDVVSGRAFEPATYEPRTLAAALRRQGAWPINDCIELGLSLSEALGHLHRNNLVHRDLKPANILFVNGAAKLGDIGLVTEIKRPEKHVSRVGTPGFMPPEGPGAPSADVYGLGKLLYEAAVGWEAERFPELPSSPAEPDDSDRVLRFHEVLWRACEPDFRRRHPSTEAFHADLRKLHKE